VIFSSKFRIAKIHVLPFQVIKSSHSWATPTYHCIRCAFQVKWAVPYCIWIAKSARIAKTISVTVEVLRVGVMIVGVISVGVMTVGVLCACMHNTHAATLDVKKTRYFLHILYREGIEPV
jgi:hypothetical protein